MTTCRIFVAVAMIGGSAVLSLVCGSVVVGTSSDYRIATAARDPQLLTIPDGTLGAEVNSDGTACLWITAQETRAAVIWPTGFAARGNPIVLYDDKGSRVAVAGAKLKVGAGQMRSITTQNVLGCSGLSVSVIGGPLLPAPEARPGTQTYTNLEVGHMAEIVGASPDIFVGFWGDPETHVITISVVPGADKNRVPSASSQLVAVASSPDPHNPKH